jgi:hypothetical protein
MNVDASRGIQMRQKLVRFSFWSKVQTILCTILGWTTSSVGETQEAVVWLCCSTCSSFYFDAI